MPLSLTERVLLSEFISIFISGFVFSASSEFLRVSILLLSSASEALEIISRKKYILIRVHGTYHHF